MTAQPSRRARRLLSGRAARRGRRPHVERVLDRSPPGQRRRRQRHRHPAEQGRRPRPGRLRLRGCHGQDRPPDLPAPAEGRAAHELRQRPHRNQLAREAAEQIGGLHVSQDQVEKFAAGNTIPTDLSEPAKSKIEDFFHVSAETDLLVAVIGAHLKDDSVTDATNVQQADLQAGQKYLDTFTQKADVSVNPSLGTWNGKKIDPGRVRCPSWPPRRRPRRRSPASRRPPGRHHAGCADVRLTVLLTTPRLPAGLLTGAAWRTIFEADRVLTADRSTALAQAVEAADVAVQALPDSDAATLMHEAAGGAVVWLASDDGDESLTAALAADVVRRSESGQDGPEVEVMLGSFDPPGSRLLDLVAVMDRLRRECPWDREQTHRSLVRYLVRRRTRPSRRSRPATATTCVRSSATCSCR